MNSYIVKEGETITDICLNTSGSIEVWNDLLDANNFNSWTPNFTNNQNLTIPYELSNENLKANNRFELVDKINELASLLSQDVSTISGITVEKKEIQPNYYIVKEGETITDICLNASGTIENWGLILTENQKNDWSPILKNGEKIVLPNSLKIDRNNLFLISQNKACNSTDINDFWDKTYKLVDSFVPPKYIFEDDYLYLFEDGNVHKFENAQGTIQQVLTYLQDGIVLEDSIYLADTL